MPKTLDENFIDWEGHAFGFGYGSGEPHVLPALKAFFATCPESGGYDYEVLERAVTPVVAWLFINRLCALDVFEYGTSPRYAWLTDRGLALKRFIDGRDVDDLVALVTGYGEDYIHCHPGACNCGPRGYLVGPICKNPFWGT